jgi:hypothetical protein
VSYFLQVPKSRNCKALPSSLSDGHLTGVARNNMTVEEMASQTIIVQVEEYSGWY